MSAFTTPPPRKCSFSKAEGHGLPSCPPPPRANLVQFRQEQAPPIPVDSQVQSCNNTLSGFFLVPPSDFLEGLEFTSEPSNLVSNRNFGPVEQLDSKRHNCKVYRLKPRPFLSPSDVCKKSFKLPPFRSIALAPRPSSSRPSLVVPHPETIRPVPQLKVSKINKEPNIKRRRISVDYVGNEAKKHSIRPIDDNCRIADNMPDFAAISFQDSDVDPSNPSHVENGSGCH